MTLSRTRHTTNQNDDGEKHLLALLQRGRDNAHRLSQHVCLLDRRLRKGAEPADLLVLIQDIKFTIEELQTLLQSAAQAVTPTPTGAVQVTDGRENHAPAQLQQVELRSLLTHCIAAARQRLHRNGAPVLFYISPDLPVLTTNPDIVAHIFSLLVEHALTASGRGKREVRVQWANETLVVDINDDGRGLAQESYTRLRQLVEQLHGTLRASHELGQRSQVELTFPPVAASDSAARQVIPLHRKEHGR